MNEAADYCGILLAAGRSRRFGADKLLHPLPDNTPIALASARTLRAVLPRVLVVVQADNTALSALLAREGFRVRGLTSDGMGDSLAAGIAAAADARGWIVALADMPFIRADSIAAVLSLLAGGAPLAAPSYRGQRGHPVGFDRQHAPDLLRLRGDQGARELLELRRAELQLVACDDAGVLRDIDTPTDL